MRVGLRYATGAVAGASLLILVSATLLPGTGSESDTWVVSTEPTDAVAQSVDSGQDWAQSEPLMGMPQMVSPPRASSRPSRRPNQPSGRE